MKKLLLLFSIVVMALSCKSNYQTKHQRTVMRKFEQPKYSRSDRTGVNSYPRKYLKCKEVKGGNNEMTKK
jgi:hypothetical protein